MVIVINKLKFHLSQFCKYYILYCYEINYPLPIIDRSFLENVVKAINSKKNINPVHMFDFFEKYYKPLMNEKINSTGYSLSIRYMITELITSFENNIKMRYFKYVKKYLYCLYNFNEYKEMLKNLESDNDIRKKLIKLKINVINNAYKCLIDEKLCDVNKYDILPNKKFNKNIFYDLECYPKDYLSSIIKMNKFLEYNDYQIFNIFPLKRSIIPGHIRIDSEQAFFSFLNKETKKEIKSFGTIGNTKNEIWREIIKTNKKIFKSNKFIFNGSIQTDGFAVSIFFTTIDFKRGKKIKKPPDELYIDDLKNTELKKLRKKEIVSIDPNKDDLIFCLSGSKEEKNLKTFRYTNNQRSKETHKRKNRKILQKEKKIHKKVLEEEMKLSEFSSKTCDLYKFIRYIHMKNKVNIQIEEFYKNILWRKLRLSTYTKTKQSEQKMVNKFKEKFGNGDNTIIAFGDWSQKEQMKFKEPTKGKSFRNLFRKAGYSVYLIDEYRTSKRCCICKNESECETFLKVKSPRPWRRNVEMTCHGLVKCKTCNTKFNRDVNSTVNIREIAKNQINNFDRPGYLKRTKKSVVKKETTIIKLRI